MIPLTTHISTLHRNQTLNAIALGITIVVGGFTIYYLVHQTKLLKLQIQKHELAGNTKGGGPKTTSSKNGQVTD